MYVINPLRARARVLNAARMLRKSLNITNVDLFALAVIHLSYVNSLWYNEFQNQSINPLLLYVVTTNRHDSQMRVNI